MAWELRIFPGYYKHDPPATFIGESFFLITDAFDKHLRIKISDKNFEWRFDDSLIIFKF